MRRSACVAAAAAGIASGEATLDFGTGYSAFIGFNSGCNCSVTAPANVYAAAFATATGKWVASGPSPVSLGSNDVCTWVSVNGLKPPTKAADGRLWYTVVDCTNGAAPAAAGLAGSTWFTTAFSLPSDDSAAPVPMGSCVYAKSAERPTSLAYDARVWADGPYYVRSSDGAVVGLSSPEGGHYAAPSTVMGLQPCNVTVITAPPSGGTGAARLLAAAAADALTAADAAVAKQQAGAGARPRPLQMPSFVAAANTADDAHTAEAPFIFYLSYYSGAGGFNASAVDPLTLGTLWSSVWACGSPQPYVCPSSLSLVRLAGPGQRRVVAVAQSSMQGLSIGFHGWANASSTALFWLTPNFPGAAQLDGSAWVGTPDAAGAAGADWPLQLFQVLQPDIFACHDATSSPATAQLVTVTDGSTFGVAASGGVLACPLAASGGGCTAQSFAHGRPAAVR